MYKKHRTTVNAVSIYISVIHESECSKDTSFENPVNGFKVETVTYNPIIMSDDVNPKTGWKEYVE
jgi:hypothetical protein